MLWPREKRLYSEFFWSVFSRILTDYGEILRISPYSVQIPENTDQKNSEYGHISSCIGVLSILCIVNELFLTDVWSFEEPLCSGAVLLIKSVIWESSPFLVFFSYIFDIFSVCFVLDISDSKSCVWKSTSQRIACTQKN